MRGGQRSYHPSEDRPSTISAASRSSSGIFRRFGSLPHTLPQGDQAPTAAACAHRVQRETKSFRPRIPNRYRRPDRPREWRLPRSFSSSVINDTPKGATPRTRPGILFPAWDAWRHHSFKAGRGHIPDGAFLRARSGQSTYLPRNRNQPRHRAKTIGIWYLSRICSKILNNTVCHGVSARRVCSTQRRQLRKVFAETRIIQWFKSRAVVQLRHRESSFAILLSVICNRRPSSSTRTDVIPALRPKPTALTTFGPHSLTSDQLWCTPAFSSFGQCVMFAGPRPFRNGCHVQQHGRSRNLRVLVGHGWPAAHAAKAA